MAISDRASVAAPAVVQIVETSSSPQPARLQVEAYLRDQLADIERQARADRARR
jgi:hypothetical protein